MIELRWVEVGVLRQLQYRVAVAVDASGGFCPGDWGEWKVVPAVQLDEAGSGDWFANSGIEP